MGANPLQVHRLWGFRYCDALPNDLDVAAHRQVDYVDIVEFHVRFAR